MHGVHVGGRRTYLGPRPPVSAAASLLSRRSVSVRLRGPALSCGDRKGQQPLLSLVVLCHPSLLCPSPSVLVISVSLD